MLFAPKPIGNLVLAPETLEQDRKKCQKIGPCGIGKEAIYLNSFFIDRTYYVTYTDVRRCFKRVAMSKGGFSGKGIFGTLPYLVVELSNGQERQCNFKAEEDVDRFLETLSSEHPDIPTHSKQAEQRLKEAKAREEAGYVKNLSAEAKAAIEDLEHAEKYLEDRPGIAKGLNLTARNKRIRDGIRSSNLTLALAIFLASIAATVFGAVEVLLGNAAWALYFILFGVAGIFFSLSSGILPTPRNNRKTAEADWEDARQKAADYIAEYPDFPVPPQYAHPVVLERMIRLIRQGRAGNASEALSVLKDDLRAMDHTKKVSQEEHDEIVEIKPLFLVMDYQ